MLSKIAKSFAEDFKTRVYDSTCFQYPPFHTLHMLLTLTVGLSQTETPTAGHKLPSLLVAIGMR